jgi:hypothetical protein
LVIEAEETSTARENIKGLRPGSKNTTIFTTEHATCSLSYVKLERLINARFVVLLVVGPISTAAMRAYYTLTLPMEFRHSSPEALHTSA